MNFADDPGAQKSATEMGKLIDEKGGGVVGTGRMILSSIADQFDANKPCVLAHSIGQVGFDIVVAIFTAGSGTAASRLGSTIRTIVTTLDKLDVLGNVVGGITGAGLKVAFKGTSKVLTFTVKEGVKLIEATVENGKYVFRIYKATVTAVSETDWKLVKMAQTNSPGMPPMNVPVFMNPADNLPGVVYRIKEILKDENGLEIKNDQGEALAEVVNTTTNESTVAIVKGVTKTLGDRLSEFKGISKKIDAFNDATKRQKFLDDFNNASDDILHKLDANDGAWVDSWKVLKDANLGDAIRTNLSNIEGLSKALKQNGYGTAYFENLLEAKADPQKFIDDYISKLGNDGKFIDNALETDYASYISRKKKEGKPPRDRADWNEASDYMKYNSPTARGNNFNRKAWDGEWYPYWEVFLDNGKYLDGYNPITKEVVSRKATDLIDISEGTFIKHLDEILEKYAPPRTIKSKKPGYENLFNKPLPSDAKLILEIPESNRTFFDIERYISIAEKKGITLKFMPE